MKKNFWWGVLWTVFVVLLSNFFIHQVIMKGTYASTPELWRTDSEIAASWPTMFLGQALVGFFLFWIYSIGYKGKGWTEAWRFAVYFGALNVGNTLIMYSVAPYSWTLVGGWIFCGFVQMWLIGMVATWSIKKWKIQPWAWN